MPEEKRKLISSVAYLKMCECKKHGCIVTAKGVNSPAFASKESGLLSIEGGETLGFLNETEVKHLRQQILDSVLPELDEEIEPAIAIQISVLNSIIDAALADAMEEIESSIEALKDVSPDEALDEIESNLEEIKNKMKQKDLELDQNCCFTDTRKVPKWIM